MLLLRISLLFGALLSSGFVFGYQGIPADLISYMDQLDVDYIPLKKSDLDESAAFFGDDVDVQIFADFDGDTRKDYALLVSSEETYVSLVVFLQRESGFIHSVLKKENYGAYFERGKVWTFIKPVHDVVKGLDGDIPLDNPGIEIMQTLGNKSKAFYWKNDGFTSVRTSD